MGNVVSEFGRLITGVGRDIQCKVMPVYTSVDLGTIVQYTGVTDSNYINGYFYKCTNSGWELTDVQDVSDKANKVAGATTDDLASLTATGDLADSGKKLSDLVLKADVKDVLNSTSTTDPLSANQGRVLNENIKAIVDVYGAKNLMPYPYYETTKTVNGVTFTDNGDGTVTVSAATYPYTVPSNTTFYFVNLFGNYFKAGTYIFNGSPIVSNDIYLNYVYYYNGAYINNQDKGNSVGFTLPIDTNNVAAVIDIVANAVLTEAITFSPMLRDARVVDDTFVPYVPTNRELMSYKANGKVGAKNLLPYPWYETTKSANGLTFTDNGDGTLTLGTGTASADTYFEFCRRFDYSVFLQNGTYLCTGCPSGVPVGVSIAAMNTDSANRYIDSGNGVEMPINGTALGNTGSYVGMSAEVKNGTVISTPITFKPMVRIAEDTDETYQPYSKTNKQLTDDKAERADLATLKLTGSTNTTGSTINKDTYFYLNGSYCKAKTNIANGATFTENTNFEVISVGGELANLYSKQIKYTGTVESDDFVHLPIGHSTPYLISVFVFTGSYYELMQLPSVAVYSNSTDIKLTGSAGRSYIIVVQII